MNVVQSSDNARIPEIKEDLEKLAETSILDCCYVIKSNLPKVEKEVINLLEIKLNGEIKYNEVLEPTVQLLE